MSNEGAVNSLSLTTNSLSMTAFLLHMVQGTEYRHINYP